jgi:hypothetical protein
MSSKEVDLTQDNPTPPRMSSSKSNKQYVSPLIAKSTNTRMPKPRLTPSSLKDAPPTFEHSLDQASESLSKAVTSAINNMDVASIHTYLKLACEKYSPIRRMIEKDFTVQGKDVMRYHRDVESENDQHSEFLASMRPIVRV